MTSRRKRKIMACLFLCAKGLHFAPPGTDPLHVPIDLRPLNLSHNFPPAEFLRLRHDTQNSLMSLSET